MFYIDLKGLFQPRIKKKIVIDRLRQRLGLEKKRSSNLLNSFFSFLNLPAIFFLFCNNFHYKVWTDVTSITIRKMSFFTCFYSQTVLTGFITSFQKPFFFFLKQYFGASSIKISRQESNKNFGLFFCNTSLLPHGNIIKSLGY